MNTKKHKARHNIQNAQLENIFHTQQKNIQTINLAVEVQKIFIILEVIILLPSPLSEHSCLVFETCLKVKETILMVNRH